MTKEQKFYKALQDVFIGAKIKGEGSIFVRCDYNGDKTYDQY